MGEALGPNATGRDRMRKSETERSPGTECETVEPSDALEPNAKKWNRPMTQFPDYLAADLRHWACFGLVYPKAQTFDPGSATPGHEAAPPRYKPGADQARIERVEEILLAARTQAFTDSTIAAAAARKLARRKALVANLPVDHTTGDAEALEAASPARIIGCRMRAILALVYGPTRGHYALEAVLCTASNEALRTAAERYYAAAAEATPVRRRALAPKPEPPPPRPIVYTDPEMTRAVRKLRALIDDLGGLIIEGAEESCPPI